MSFKSLEVKCFAKVFSRTLSKRRNKSLLHDLKVINHLKDYIYEVKNGKKGRVKHNRLKKEKGEGKSQFEIKLKI